MTDAVMFAGFMLIIILIIIFIGIWIAHKKEQKRMQSQDPFPMNEDIATYPEYETARQDSRYRSKLK